MNEGLAVLRFLEDRIVVISTIERVVNNPYFIGSLFAWHDGNDRYRK